MSFSVELKSFERVRQNSSPLGSEIILPREQELREYLENHYLTWNVDRKIIAEMAKFFAERSLPSVADVKLRYGAVKESGVTYKLVPGPVIEALEQFHEK